MPHFTSSGAADACPQSKPAERHRLRFGGSLVALQNLVLLTGAFGDWEEKPNGIWRYRSEDRAGLNWSSTRGTVWFDGPEQARERLKHTIEPSLRSWRARPLYR